VRATAGNLTGIAKVAKIDVSKHRDSGAHFQIRFVPTFVLLKDGEELGRTGGMRDPVALTAWVKERL
jgi:thioredoxin-like negative regulator of GroEL